MSPADKSVWEKKSEEDKARYQAEKQFYRFANRGKTSKRIMKDHDAPKRPMSAFLAFSNERRAELKKLHPGVSNGGLSKMLSQQWKEISPDSKAKYVDNEAELRAKYKTDMAEFRKRKSAEAKMNKKLEDAVEVKRMEERLRRARMEQDRASPDVQQAPEMRSSDGVASLRAYQDGNAVFSSLLGGRADVAGLTNMNSLLLSGGGGHGMSPSLAGVSGLGLDTIATLAGTIPNDRLALALSHQQLLDRLQGMFVVCLPIRSIRRNQLNNFLPFFLLSPPQPNRTSCSEMISKTSRFFRTCRRCKAGRNSSASLPREEM